MIFLEENDGMTWIGTSGNKVAPIPPHSALELVLRMVPLQPGLHSISRIKFLDGFLKKYYTFDDLGQVFVVVPKK